jgi:hypothetical protein
MRTLRLLLLILIGLTSFGYAANATNKEEKVPTQNNKKAAKEEKNYNLRFAWWEMPNSVPDLYVLSGNKYISVSPRNMSMSPGVALNCEEKVDLLKKIISEEKDNNGRPKESYEIYSSINLTQTESHDVGILLFPNKQKNIAGARVYDFSPRGFPYGSFIVVNFTQSKVSCTVDESKFVVMPGPGTFGRLPKPFTERTVASVGIVVTDNSGVENQIVSTKSVFNQLFRTLYFVIPSQGANKYDVRCIMDIDSTPAKSSDSSDSASEDTNSKSPKSKKAAQ